MDKNLKKMIDNVADGDMAAAGDAFNAAADARRQDCLLYTSPSPRDRQNSRMPSSA